MKLKDAIKEIENKINVPFDIEYRITLPDYFEESDTLYGYCMWNGTELISLDQDDYSLEDEILSYEIFEVSDDFAEFSGEKALSVLIEGMYLSSENTWVNTDTIEKDKSRAQRRHNDYKKAIRKRKIARKIYTSSDNDTWEYYNNLHQYSDNKIHCSCPMCRAKTNAKLNKGSGTRYFNGDGPLLGATWGSTAHREGDNLSAADKKKFDSMSEKLKDYQNGVDDIRESNHD